MSQKIIRKRFDIQVATLGELVKKDFQLEKTIKQIVGLTITSDRDDLLFYRGSQKIEINGAEIFPDGYESKLLIAGISLAPNDRYYTLLESEGEIGNGIVSISYQDTDHPLAPFNAYRVSLYIEAEV